MGYVCYDIFFPNGLRGKKEEAKQIKKTVLNIGAPTNICSLPIWVAEEDSIFDSLKVSITVKDYEDQLACDMDFCKGDNNMEIIDPERAAWIKKSKGAKFNILKELPLDYAMIANSKSRVNRITQLKDKVMAISRYSSYSEAAYKAIDSVKMKRDSVYIVQVNSPSVALKMIQANELDAAFFPEPYMSALIALGNNALVKKKMVCQLISSTDSNIEKEVEKFLKAYAEAEKRIKKNGLDYYSQLLQRRCKYSQPKYKK